MDAMDDALGETPLAASGREFVDAQVQAARLHRRQTRQSYVPLTAKWGLMDFGEDVSTTKHKSLHDFQSMHRQNLLRLLRELLRDGRHADAAGVLSILLQSTCFMKHDSCLVMMVFEAAITILTAEDDFRDGFEREMIYDMLKEFVTTSMQYPDARQLSLRIADLQQAHGDFDEAFTTLRKLERWQEFESDVDVLSLCALSQYQSWLKAAQEDVQRFFEKEDSMREIMGWGESVVNPASDSDEEDADDEDNNGDDFDSSEEEGDDERGLVGELRTGSDREQDGDDTLGNILESREAGGRSEMLSRAHCDSIAELTIREKARMELQRSFGGSVEAASGDEAGRGARAAKNLAAELLMSSLSSELELLLDVPMDTIFVEDAKFWSECKRFPSALYDSEEMAGSGVIFDQIDVGMGELLWPEVREALKEDGNNVSDGGNDERGEEEGNEEEDESEKDDERGEEEDERGEEEDERGEEEDERGEEEDERGEEEDERGEGEVSESNEEHPTEEDLRSFQSYPIKLQQEGKKQDKPQQVETEERGKVRRKWSYKQKHLPFFFPFVPTHLRSRVKIRRHILHPQHRCLSPRSSRIGRQALDYLSLCLRQDLSQHHLLLPMVQLILVLYPSEGILFSRQLVAHCCSPLKAASPEAARLLSNLVSASRPPQRPLLLRCHLHLLRSDPTSAQAIRGIIRAADAGVCGAGLLMEACALFLDSVHCSPNLVNPQWATSQPNSGRLSHAAGAVSGGRVEGGAEVSGSNLASSSPAAVWLALADSFLAVRLAAFPKMLKGTLQKWTEDDVSNCMKPFRFRCLRSEEDARNLLIWLWSDRRRWWQQRQFDADNIGHSTAQNAGPVRQPTPQALHLLCAKAAAAAHVLGPSNKFTSAAMELLQLHPSLLRIVAYHRRFAEPGPPSENLLRRLEGWETGHMEPDGTCRMMLGMEG